MTAEPFDPAAGEGGLLSIFQADETGNEPWMSDSLCAQIDPEMFFPEKGGSTREAKRICLSCDVRSECLDYALRTEERFGIWGGLSERERRRLKRSGNAGNAGDAPEDEDEETTEDPADEAGEDVAEVIQLSAVPVFDNSVTVRKIEPQLPPLTGDSRLLVLNCLSIVAGSGGTVTNFRQLLRRLSFSSEQQFLRFLRMQERRGFLECQLTSVSASRISITLQGRQYLKDSKFGQTNQEGSDGMKDSKRFPAIRAYVESLPGQILVVSGSPKSGVSHDLLRAAKLDNVNELRRVLRKLGREVLDAELTEDPDDGTLMLVFGKVSADETADALPEVPAEVLAELSDEAEAAPADEEPAEAVLAEEAPAAIETAIPEPEEAPELVAVSLADIPVQRESEPVEVGLDPVQTVSVVPDREMAVLRWFADNGGEVPVPAPRVAELLNVSLVTARGLLQAIRRNKGWLDSRGNTRGTVYFLTPAGWELLGLEPVAPQAVAAPAEPEPLAAQTAEEPASAELQLTSLQAAALRGFAVQSGDIYAPRTRLAEDLSITRTAAKKLIYGLRAAGYVETDGPTVTCRYFLTDQGLEVLAGLPETVAPVSLPENKSHPDAALAKSMARTRGLLQALADTPGNCWYRCKAIDVNQHLPADLRFSDSSDLNKFLRRLAMSGLVEQECKGSHRSWLRITPEGLDWLRLPQPDAPGKDLVLAEISQPVAASAPDPVMVHRELPRSMRTEDARIIEVCRMLYDRPSHYWATPSVQEINDGLPDWLQLGNPANINGLIRLAEARGDLEQYVNGRRRVYAKLTEQGVGLVESHMTTAEAGEKGTDLVARPAEEAPVQELSAEELAGQILRISDSLGLSIDAIVKRFAILGTSGSGKTSTTVVMVEEMIRLDWPVLILDPQGVWWGLRSSADGKSPGLPVLVIGGEHGDIPLDPNDGYKIAQLLEEQRRPIVVDTYDLDDEQAAGFVADLFEALYNRPRNAKPIFLVVDEADEFAPQHNPPGVEKSHVEAIQRLKRAALRLAKRGRTRGIGQAWITQRPQEFHKGVLGQLEVLVAMRFSSVRDIQVINEWLSSHNGDAEVARVKTVLPELDTGTGLFYCPYWLGPLKKVAVRPRWTFDSSATPDPRQSAVEPDVLAEIDMDAIAPYFDLQLEAADAYDDDLDDLPVETPQPAGSAETPEPQPEEPPAQPAALPQTDGAAQALLELMQKHLALSIEHDHLQAELRRVSEELVEAEVARSAAQAENQALIDRIDTLESLLAKGDETSSIQRRVVQALLDQLPPSTADKVILSVVGGAG